MGHAGTDHALGALAEVVARSGLIDPISSGVVLVSGGADSACAAAGLARAIGPANVHALHVNYRLRESADRDSGVRDSGVRDSARRESGALDDVTRVVAASVSAGRTSVTSVRLDARRRPLTSRRRGAGSHFDVMGGET